MEKINQFYVFLTLVECHFAIASFNLRMSKGAYDLLTLVITFLESDCQLKHVTISFFETTKIIRHALAQSLIDLLDKYGLRKKIIANLMHARSNLTMMTNALKSIVSCEYFCLEKCHWRTYFGHVFPKHVNMAC
jgi:hypothetical protein